MAEYEASIAPVKRRLFAQLIEDLRATAPAGAPPRLLEMGIGTGPNLPYYASSALLAENGLHIIGVDRNPFMLPHLRSAAAAAGWPAERLEWVEGRAEALPLPCGSVDAVVCTLVRALSASYVLHLLCVRLCVKRRRAHAGWTGCLGRASSSSWLCHQQTCWEAL